jgi:NTE family protein
MTGSVQAAERLKVGLALSGGGARGAAHIGVIKELERQGIPIDYVAGTSMGAIVGGLYASGRSTADIEQILNEIDWAKMFKDSPKRKNASIRRKFDDDVFQVNKQLGLKGGKVQLPSGFIKGQNLQLLFDRLFLSVSHLESFDHLNIPFRAVATDISTGEAVVIGDGSLATAVRASMSVPSIFATVPYKNFILVDGGISNNLPVDVVREMGADVVIAVDIGSGLIGRDNLDSLLNVSLQLTGLLVINTTKRQIETLTDRDILIVPDLGSFSSSDFSNASQVVINGVTATELLSDRLKPLAIQENTADQGIAGGTFSGDQSPLIASIRIENDTILDDAFIRARLTQKPGEVLDFDQLEKDIAIIYGLGNFESVTYDIEHHPQGKELVLNVTEKSWGPRYLQFGLRFDSNLSDENDLSGTIGYTVSPFNSWNGEWRTFLFLGEEGGVATELNLPLALNSPYYVNGSLSFLSEQFNTFLDGHKINQIQVDKPAATISLGRELDLWGDLRLGLTSFRSNNKVTIGLVENPIEDSDGGEFFTRFRFDTLNDRYFPTGGNAGFLKWVSSRDDLGADFEFDQILIDGLNVSSWGEKTHTLFLGARYYSTVDGFAPVPSRFRMGGLFELPGFSSNELSGQNLYLLRSGYQRKISGLFNKSPYLGFSIQHGNTFMDKNDIDLSEGITAGSVWLGWKTLLGPIYLGYGQADTNNHSLYLRVGGFY